MQYFKSIPTHMVSEDHAETSGKAETTFVIREVRITKAPYVNVIGTFVEIVYIVNELRCKTSSKFFNCIFINYLGKLVHLYSCKLVLALNETLYIYLYIFICVTCFRIMTAKLERRSYRGS